MNKKMSWNNRRRPFAYWLSVALLLLTAQNISWWFSLDDCMIRVVGRQLVDFYEYILPSYAQPSNIYAHAITLMLCTFSLFTALFIVLINHFAGLLPDVRRKDGGGLFRFVYKSAFLVDVPVGVLLEIAAVYGLYRIADTFKPSSTGFLGYIAFFCFGSALYWTSVFPIRKYLNIKSMIARDEAYESSFWYCITNSKLRLSVFDRVPQKGIFKEVIVDSSDLKAISGDSGRGIRQERFFYYLIAIDQGEEITESFLQQIRSISLIPHAKILVLLFGTASNQIQAGRLEAQLAECKNARVHHLPEQKLTRELDIWHFLTGAELKAPLSTQHPLRFIKQEQLVQTYLSAGKSAGICQDFLYKIIHELEVLPGIYALFDFADLQYRLATAYEQPWCSPVSDNEKGQDAQGPSDVYAQCLAWMQEHGNQIGNINKMANLLENSAIRRNYESGRIQISTETMFHEIISLEEMQIIHKYLPNYQIDRTRPAVDTTVKLTTNLRNVLRGHGYFDVADASKLFELVFKLAIMNAYILSAEDISLAVHKVPVWDDQSLHTVLGHRKNGTTISLSPFLVASQDGNILVFNNWHKDSAHGKTGTIEYISYLDGTLILPEYLSIDVHDSNRAGRNENSCNRAEYATESQNLH